MSAWTVFSNHGHVLLFLASFPEARLRDVAEKVGITERAVQKIVKDLQDGQFVSVHKHGRRNRYRINARKALRHELESHKTIGSLVKLIDKGAKKKGKASVDSDLAPTASAAPVTAQIEEHKSPAPVGQEPKIPDFENPNEYSQLDYEAESELVSISTYDSFEEAAVDFEAEAELVAEAGAPDVPPAEQQARKVPADQAVSQPVTTRAKDPDAKPPAKKTARKTKKNKPPDEQQGSLF